MAALPIVYTELFNVCCIFRLFFLSTLRKFVLLCAWNIIMCAYKLLIILVIISVLSSLLHPFLRLLIM